MIESRWRRTSAIFLLALSFWGDSRRLARARRTLTESEARQREGEILAAGGARFRETALRLGGLVIKVGQFLSARTDILPLTFTRELAQLQDQVPEAPWAEVHPLMVEEWGKPLSEIFTHIDEHSLAAASLGQVHYARLQTGQEVAVKVQRPNIKRLAAIDLSALRMVLRVINRATRVGRRINLSHLFEEFQALVERELDYHQEAEYLSRFRRNFATEADIVVPGLFPDFTRGRVFVMEYLSGIKLTDGDKLAEAGLSAHQLANLLIHTYLKQIALDGFVQIDPHAGNFLADAQGRLILLDFGMVAVLPAHDLDAIVMLIQGILGKNADIVIAAIDALGFVRPSASRRLLRRAVEFLLDRLSGVELEPGPQLDRAVEEFQDFLYHEPLEFPVRYMFLGRAVGMLFGLVSQLNPDLEWMPFLQKEALPLLQRRQQQSNPAWISSLGGWTQTLLGDQAGAALQTALGLGVKGVADVARLPGQLGRVLALIEAGELATNPELTGVLRRLDAMQSTSRAQLQLLWAGLLGAAAWAVHVSLPAMDWVTWACGSASLVIALRALWTGRRTSGRRPS